MDSKYSFKIYLPSCGNSDDCRRPRFCRGGQDFAHFVGVEPAQVIALSVGFDNITVVLPEGTPGSLLVCSFEQDVADAAARQIVFAFGQRAEGYADAAKFLCNVESDDVGEGRIFFGGMNRRCACLA